MPSAGNVLYIGDSSLCRLIDMQCACMVHVHPQTFSQIIALLSVLYSKCLYTSFQHNVVVVNQQPQVHAVHYTARNSDYGTGALVFAIVVTFFIIFFGCWWSLICSIAGIAFAANVSIKHLLHFIIMASGIQLNYSTNIDMGGINVSQ